MIFYICEKIDLFKSHYIYIDCKKYLAADFFIKNNIKVKYGKELDYPNTDYKIMFVSVSNKKDYLFVKSMCELEDRIIERGYEDYLDICDKIFSNISKSKKKVKKCII